MKLTRSPKVSGFVIEIKNSDVSHVLQPFGSKIGAQELQVLKSK